MSEFLSDYHFEFPPELVAQTPLSERSASRMLVVDPVEKSMSHHYFKDLLEFLNPGDLLVGNDTQVRPCRFFARKETGGQVELLLLQERPHEEWEVLLSPSRGLKVGTPLFLFRRDTGEVAPIQITMSSVTPGPFRVQFKNPEEAQLAFTRFGEMPLPPYISRPQSDAADSLRYQTVFAKNPGAAAAPTAGLHFTEAMKTRLKEAQVAWTTVTLHVGLGTFLPIRSERIVDHVMHREWYRIEAQTLAALQRCRERGAKVVAVGTTSLRALEAFAATGQSEGVTDLFIRPGYRPKMVQALLTNFHQPKSTLLILVAALGGREFMLKTYQAAMENKYRLFSYGDCMLLRNFR